MTLWRVKNPPTRVAKNPPNVCVDPGTSSPERKDAHAPRPLTN